MCLSDFYYESFQYKNAYRESTETVACLEDEKFETELRCAQCADLLGLKSRTKHMYRALELQSKEQSQEEQDFKSLTQVLLRLSVEAKPQLFLSRISA